ncbi:hypothetical protein SAMN05421856_105317 [Chryseobacterium taichungense]|uniref:Uncharacterized protein n=1 Tax=Chryseobacterium taichungense TaxID=295069 RepID=A0A1H8AF91_9FLAO|nr:hypothetical protein [Chryseobacterium taichungense]SEM69512.1 hypothetical protein SAMN05421856_105317 [Chryseobacterium taichungense]
MKNSNLKNAQKLSRESQKQILGGDLILVCATGCHRNYLSDGSGRCIVPPCTSPNFGTESQDANGRWQCCY